MRHSTPPDLILFLSPVGCTPYPWKIFWPEGTNHIELVLKGLKQEKHQQRNNKQQDRIFEAFQEFTTEKEMTFLIRFETLITNIAHKCKPCFKNKFGGQRDIWILFRSSYHNM